MSSVHARCIQLPFTGPEKRKISWWLCSHPGVEAGNRISIRRDRQKDRTGGPPLFTVQNKKAFFRASSFFFFLTSPPTNKPTDNINTMPDNAAPAPAAAEEVKLYKDEVTGEMISKSYVFFFFFYLFDSGSFLRWLLFSGRISSVEVSWSCISLLRCVVLLMQVASFLCSCVCSSEQWRETIGKEQQSNYIPHTHTLVRPCPCQPVTERGGFQRIKKS